MLACLTRAESPRRVCASQPPSNFWRRGDSNTPHAFVPAASLGGYTPIPSPTSEARNRSFLSKSYRDRPVLQIYTHIATPTAHTTMPHATSLPAPGFQALILCGPGASFSTFTSTPKEIPKALLPIANRPMVWYPLEWCYRMGVTGMPLHASVLSICTKIF